MPSTAADPAVGIDDGSASSSPTWRAMLIGSRNVAWTKPSMVSTVLGGGTGAGSGVAAAAAGRRGGVAGEVDVLHRHAHPVDPVGDRVMHLRTATPPCRLRVPRRRGTATAGGCGRAGRARTGWRGRAADAAYPERAGRPAARGGRCRSRDRRPRSGHRVPVGLGWTRQPRRGTPWTADSMRARRRSKSGARSRIVTVPNVDAEERILLDAPHQRLGVAHLAVGDGDLGRRTFVVGHAPSLPRRSTTRQARSKALSSRRAARPRAAPVASPATTSEPWWMRT